jgi:hypothetical protein
VPCLGNLQIVQSVMFSSTGGAPIINSITDTRSATYTERGSNVQGVALDPAQVFDASGNPDDETVLTVNLAAAQNGGSTIFVTDVANAHPTAPFDAVSELTGNQTSSGDLNIGSLAPNTGQGIVFAHVSVNSHTVNGLNAPGQFTPFTNPTEDGGSNPLHQDNGWGFVHASDKSAQSFVWTTQNNTAGVGTWGAKIAAYKGNILPGAASNLGKMISPPQRMA